MKDKRAKIRLVPTAAVLVASLFTAAADVIAPGLRRKGRSAGLDGERLPVRVAYGGGHSRI